MKLTNQQVIAARSHGRMTGSYAEEALAIEVLETRALLANLNEEWLEEIITDSIDLDWTPRTAARAIVQAMKAKWRPDQWLGFGKVD
jgi:hypothetical protein